MDETEQARDVRRGPGPVRQAIRALVWTGVGVLLFGVLAVVRLGSHDCDCRARGERYAAISILRGIADAQAELHGRALLDRDGDGVGEYGSFGELSGAVALPATGEPFDPPLLPRAFQESSEGVLRRAGYRFAIYLPDRDGCGIRLDSVAIDSPVDPDACEGDWCAYAWPEALDEWNSVFFIDHSGASLCAPAVLDDGSAYIGPAGPEPDAAFRPGEARGTITGLAADGTRGVDGRIWSVLE